MIGFWSSTRRRGAVVRRVVVGIGMLLSAGMWLAAAPPALPDVPGSLRFAVIGDMGTGARPQFEVAAQMAALRARFSYDLVLMVGDNLYGRQRPEDIVAKFERPYAPLLQAGVLFYGALGNHDDPETRFYPPFHMNGERYYSFVRQDTRFFVLDTNRMDRTQVTWVERALRDSRERWKIVIFHHPLYSNARRHGSDMQLRIILEPLLVRAGVNVVFSGHDHVYERSVPQKGITYFVTGSSGKLSPGDVRRSPATAAAFDDDNAFVIVEIAGESLHFEAIARSGATVDSGVVRRRPQT
jgi:3',5'-cyclic AMP phosphodiesterase CpdA